MTTDYASFFIGNTKGRPKKKKFSQDDMLRLLSEGLVKQANEPNMDGYKPHVKQLAFHQAEANAKMYIGGNRSGKTTAGVIEDLWWATKRHPYRGRDLNNYNEIRGRVVGVDFISGVKTILLPIFRRWVLPSDLVNGSWEDSWSNEDRTLSFSNGSSIEFKSYEQGLDHHAGTSRHFIHFDEEPPKAIWQENILRLVDTAGSWWMTMTPVENMTWTFYDLYEPRPNGLFVLEVNTDDNPYLTEEGKAAAFGFLNEGEVSIRKEGKYNPRGGLVFYKFQREEPWVIPQSLPSENDAIYVSVDHGWTNPTAVLWHYVTPNRRAVTFHEIYVRKMRIYEICQLIKNFNHQILHREPLFYTGDPAMKQTNAITGTSAFMEYGMNGIPLALEGVPRNVLSGIEMMMKYDELREDGKPTWQIGENCINLIKEKTGYMWKTRKGKAADQLNTPEEPVKKNDHALDSARYFFSLLPELIPLDKNINDSFTPTPGTIWDTFIKMSQPLKQGDLYRPLHIPVSPQTNWNVFDENFDNMEADGYE